MSTQEANVVQREGDGLRIAFGVGGLVAIVLGLLVLFFPTKSGAVALQIVAVVLAAYALVTGVVYVGMALFGRSKGGWARTGHILLGLLYIAGGVIMIANLGATAVVLAVFLTVTVGILWLLEGVLAFVTLKQSENKVWTIVFGLLSIVAGIVLILSPLVSAVTLWFLLGLSMLVLGVVQVVRAFSMKSAA